jgi:GTP-binding protein
MLIDEIKIKISAGNGGRGSVAFNKNLMSLGPAGGSGGRGGNVYVEGVSDISALGQFRFKKEFSAESGRDGRDQFRDGHDGKDLILKVPVGSVIYKQSTDGEPGSEEISIEKTGQQVLLASGGKGGRGNLQFKSAHNTSPKHAQSGLPGESFKLHIELKLIADVGFVGLPNAGKSSMLNQLTKAQSKVGNYAFTTLEPNLGVYYKLILADIPGLIEGSSTGRGLGVKFLRHIERTHILFHFVSAESESPVADYKTIRAELGAYSKALLKKPEYVFLTKCDLLRDEKIMKSRLTALKKLNKNTIAISIHDPASIKQVEKILNGIQDEK